MACPVRCASFVGQVPCAPDRLVRAPDKQKFQEHGAPDHLAIIYLLRQSLDPGIPGMNKIGMEKKDDKVPNVCR
jgi:hypothetical protein